MISLAGVCGCGNVWSVTHDFTFGEPEYYCLRCGARVCSPPRIEPAAANASEASAPE